MQRKRGKKAGRRGGGREDRGAGGRRLGSKGSEWERDLQRAGPSKSRPGVITLSVEDKGSTQTQTGPDSLPTIAGLLPR